MSGAPTTSGPRAMMAAIGETARELGGVIVRATLGTTAESLWRTLTGYLPDGTRAFRDAEVFSGIGVYARPPTNANAEAIVGTLGGEASAAVVLATRDEGTRRAMAGNINADETILYNSVSVVLVKSTGAIELRTANGTAVALAKASDLTRLRGAIVSAAATTLAGNPTGSAALTAIVTALDALLPPWPSPTTTIKGE